MDSNFKDWHRADIISTLRKKGTTLAQISRAAGLSSSTLGNTLVRPWPKGEYIIAQAIGIEPQKIWPSRYYDPVSQKPLNRKPKLDFNKNILDEENKKQ